MAAMISSPQSVNTTVLIPHLYTINLLNQTIVIMFSFPRLFYLSSNDEVKYIDESKDQFNALAVCFHIHCQYSHSLF